MGSNKRDGRDSGTNLGRRDTPRPIQKLLMDPFRICEDNLIGTRIDPKNLLFFPVFSPGVGGENHFFLWKKFRREAIYNLMDVTELGKHSTTEVTSKTPNLASDISSWLFELLPLLYFNYLFLYFEVFRS